VAERRVGGWVGGGKEKEKGEKGIGGEQLYAL
jgi:hypothetical protein